MDTTILKQTETPSDAIPASLATLQPEIDTLRETGAMFHQRGWSLATSSNYSIVVKRNPLELLITASGKDKGRLSRSDFVRVDDTGSLIVDSVQRASAETLLHVVVAQCRPVGAILHTHSVWSTVLSQHFQAQGAVSISGFEMLKGLADIPTHRHNERLTIFENTQDIPALADQVGRWLDSEDGADAHGFLIAGHGLYTWGEDLAAARRHIETFEFLFECVGRNLSL